MAFRNSENHYGSIAQLLHWVIAALVLIQFPLGLYVDGLPIGIERLQWMSRHKSLGILLLAIVLLRVTWRLLNHAPPLPPSMSLHERRAASATHGLLYGLLIAAPLAGWMQASAAGLGVNFFGWFQLPDVVARSTDSANLFGTVHAVLVWMLVAVIVLHVAAALRHAFWLKDSVMQRMLPRSRKRRN